MCCISRRNAWRWALLLAAASPAAACAQGWTETQLWAVGTASRPALGAAGAGLAWRDGGRTRVGLAVAAGLLEGGEAAGRLEAAWHFLLDPGRRSGAALYGGGGLAVATAQPGGRVAARLLLTLGVESAPAAPRGLFLEAGVGGGARVAAGLRWRTRRAPPGRP